MNVGKYSRTKTNRAIAISFAHHFKTYSQSGQWWWRIWFENGHPCIVVNFTVLHTSIYFYSQCDG